MSKKKKPTTKTQTGSIYYIFHLCFRFLGLRARLIPELLKRNVTGIFELFLSQRGEADRTLANVHLSELFPRRTLGQLMASVAFPSDSPPAMKASRVDTRHGISLRLYNTISIRAIHVHVYISPCWYSRALPAALFSLCGKAGAVLLYFCITRGRGGASDGAGAVQDTLSRTDSSSSDGAASRSRPSRPLKYFTSWTKRAERQLCHAPGPCLAIPLC